MSDELGNGKEHNGRTEGAREEVRSCSRRLLPFHPSRYAVHEFALCVSFVQLADAALQFVLSLPFVPGSIGMA
jgi:hypothetical protein